MLESFSDDKIQLPSGISLRVRTAGSGPVVLLLHGYPQTHMCWHKVAPLLVEAGYHVVLSDLRGYPKRNDSSHWCDVQHRSKRALCRPSLRSAPMSAENYG